MAGDSNRKPEIARKWNYFSRPRIKKLLLQNVSYFNQGTRNELLKHEIELFLGNKIISPNYRQLIQKFVLEKNPHFY